MHIRSLRKAPIVFMLALAIAALPNLAFASTDSLEVAPFSQDGAAGSHGATKGDGGGQGLAALLETVVATLADKAEEAEEAEEAESAIAAAEADKANKLLAYDPAAIAAVGSQAQSGHSICCPSYACAYADAVLDGTVHDHSYYTCSCCTWTDWGGGGSSYRCVGTDEELLREAHDQIESGRPTVIHVGWSGGEHWIALIGYENAVDPDHLTLSNFIALDPWDGVQVNAAEKYVLYGDGCEHVSDR